MAHVIFWLDTSTEPPTPRHELYGDLDLIHTLRRCEVLRKCSNHSHVVISSENPNSVGKPGVSDPPADYDWKKRRD